jgi:MFS family permease
MSNDTLPRGIHNAYLFQAFNAVSWQICLGSPLILFARELGAPAVVLGLLAGLAPLTSSLQLLVAPHAERIGYRKLLLSGWTARVTTLVFLTLLPLSAALLPPATVIALLVAIMVAFTSLRGIATVAWMPWITAIVPRPLRGAYLSRDRTFISIASVGALALSGLLLVGHDSVRAYSVVFGLSFLGGAVSLYFLNRIPEPPADTPAIQPHARTPWRKLWLDGPFVRLLVFSAIVQLCVLSTTTFVTVFVRVEVGLPDGVILWLTAGASLVGILALHLLRRRADVFGSRPFLGVVVLWWIFYYLAWFLLAAHLVEGAWLIAPALLLAAGFFAATYELALTRLLMNTVGDRPDTTQYFALQSVSVSLVAGIAPILWGWLLDELQHAQWQFGRLTVDGFAVFFGLQWLLLGLVLIALEQVKETSATPTAVLLRRAWGSATHPRLSWRVGHDRR